ncbi:hypothetical protein M5689_024424 [Euphorbia peplus]|nr:hypothetical protein M5689_024424 [Euphorbia peplus]
MDEWRRSGQIPAFGDWEKANEMPITQYFESARQAGLIRHTSSGDCDHYMHPPPSAAHFNKTSQHLHPPPTKIIRGRERRMSNAVHMKKEQKKQGKVYDVTEPLPTKQMMSGFGYGYGYGDDSNKTIPKIPKPVDEDLYKIPPHLLRSSKRKKLPGFFSCLVPACAS